MKKHMLLISVYGKWEVSNTIHMNEGDIITVHFGSGSERDTVAVQSKFCGDCIFKNKDTGRCVLRKSYSCGISGISLVPIETVMEDI